ncbi:hypothetical protein BC332_11456 [Capsicum chinense]|nr:hypothetical protein BC332_11456 [Capsicum chinense]
MELVPALVNCGKELDHLLQVLLSHALGSAQSCFHLCARNKAVDTCPFPLVSDDDRLVFSTSVLEQYARIENAFLFPDSSLICKAVSIGNFRPSGGTLPDTHHATKTAVAERLAAIYVLPLLLASALGSPRKHELLIEYLRNLLIQTSGQESQTVKHEIFYSVRVLWFMLFYIDAFGAVAQQFKNDVIVDEIRIQMDAFLEDGSHEATLAVVRALVMAVPHTTERLRDYILNLLAFMNSLKTCLYQASLMKPDLQENSDHDIDDGGNEIDDKDLT